MNTDLHNDTLAAVHKLASVPHNPVAPPKFELLEEFYQTHYSDRDPLWQQIKADERLMLLFHWLVCPLLGRSPLSCPDSETPALRSLLSDVLSSQSELPTLREMAETLDNFLDREGL